MACILVWHAISFLVVFCRYFGLTLAVQADLNDKSLVLRNTGT
jgi:hypothetical protein